MFLLNGLSFPLMLPIYPANERRDSDQYAESREHLPADGGHCRTSGIVGNGFNGSYLLHTDVHTPLETIWIMPRKTCSYSRPVQGMIASILQLIQQDKPAIDAPTAEDMFQGASGQANQI